MHFLKNIKQQRFKSALPLLAQQELPHHGKPSPPATAAKCSKAVGTGQTTETVSSITMPGQPSQALSCASKTMPSTCKPKAE